ncbi:Ima1 N-terminal domain-containing protein [Halteromyces radiatus]|uniref:Ima1 N-terminal domain-containing protein n=1 Tax=Halteromyces radiatus TaxID=101107 RepID=UPI00221F5359|nr:Ima1 N-terminal domain-containing protein [Halteromyces radiatus]KAI8099244.1 Ima1 N-terminal domain-containing protein [Halteromyces radiatus]
MDGYVTRQSPTWRNWFAYKLGFTDLPTRVNCWYCNQTSYLLPGSKQTVRHWYCRLCENTNAIDQYGDIMDAPPIPETSSTSAYGSSLKQRKKYQQSRSSSTTMPTKDQRTLCENCQRNQILIYQFMSEYLRDENDADYDYRVQHAREYQESLNNKHPLCAECQDKLQDVLAEQRDSLRRLKINEKRQLSMQSKIPTRISLSQYRWYASFWLILHSSVLFLCIFAVFYPPQPINHNETLTSIQDALKLLYYCFLYPFQQNEQDHTIISLSSSLPRAPSISSQIEWLFSRDAVIKFFWFTVNNLNSMMRFICYATYQLFSFVMVSSHSTIDSTILFDEDIESVKISSWDVTDIGIFCYIVFYTMSFPYMYWHIKVSRLFFKPSNLLGWQVYKVM